MSTCTRKLVTDQIGIRDVRGYTTDDQTSTRKLVRNFEPLVDKKPQFEIDLRKEEYLKMLSYKMKRRLNEINEKLEKFKMGLCANSIRNELSKGKMIFSEETSRAICEMGNMELIALKQTLATLQCLSCLYDGTNQSSFCSVEKSIHSYHSNPVKREKKWT